MAKLGRPMIPSHVPPGLIADVDVYDVPGGNVDPQLAWRCLVGKGPVVFSPYNGGHWIATSGTVIAKFYRDSEHFSSAQISVPVVDGDWMLPVNADPPFHSEYRRNIMPLFSPAAVERLAPSIRSLTIDLVTNLQPKGTCEFVRDFASQLPIDIFMSMMDLPLADKPHLRRLVDTFASDPDVDRKRAAHAELHEYLDLKIDERLLRPGSDAITMLTQAQIGDRPYTREEMLGTLTMLLHGGLDTVTNMLGFFVLHLARNPDDRTTIANNPSKIPGAVQEMLRRYSVPNLSRIVAKDYEIDGVLMKKGDMIMLPPSLFNLDEAVNEDATRVDFARSGRHVTFGSGVHTCPGATLARRELTIFLEEWLSRIPEFQVDETKPLILKAQPNNLVEELWLTW